MFLMLLSACSSRFTVKSEPAAADVFWQDPKTGEKKPIGKTPLEMPKSELKNIVGDAVDAGQFFNVVVEKPGYLPSTFNIPMTGFGTMATMLDVKLKEGTAAKEARVAKVMLDRLFLAQKFALSAQYERAQIELDSLLKEFPEFSRAMSMRASIYFAQKNYSESLKWYEEALKVDPQMEDAVKMAAKVRALQSGQRLPASTPAAPAGGATP